LGELRREKRQRKESWQGADRLGQAVARGSAWRRHAPDFEYRGSDKDTSLDFIHRSTGDSEIYFVTNRKERQEQAECAFRVSGKRPELWDPVTGETRPAEAFKQAGGRTTLPWNLLPMARFS